MHQRTGLLCQHTASHAGLVVELRLCKQIDDRAGGAGFGLGCAKHHTLKPRMEHGATAHGAGFQRDIQRAAVKPIIAHHLGGGTQGHDFSVGRWVVAINRGVAAGCNHHAGPHDDRADRYFARCGRQARFGQRQRHEIFIGGCSHGSYQINSIPSPHDGRRRLF